jgi:hypothetical protein
VKLEIGRGMAQMEILNLENFYSHRWENGGVFQVINKISRVVKVLKRKPKEEILRVFLFMAQYLQFR